MIVGGGPRGEAFGFTVRMLVPGIVERGADQILGELKREIETRKAN